MLDDKKKLASFVKELIDAFLLYQRKDGLFHNIIDDQSTFIETNFAQMVSYTIYSGVAGGWLDNEYLQHANKMREAAYEKVDEHGLVQGVCSSPTFAAPGTAVEGQAFFLLMEVAASKFDSD
jgi:rhamnogalacturonyl hydrolase YesR